MTSSISIFYQFKNLEKTSVRSVTADLGELKKEGSMKLTHRWYGSKFYFIT